MAMRVMRRVSFAINSRHSGMRRPNSGLPEFGIIIVQVGNSRPGCAGPESITPDRGYGFRVRAEEGAPRNDGIFVCCQSVTVSRITGRKLGKSHSRPGAASSRERV